MAYSNCIGWGTTPPIPTFNSQSDTMETEARELELYATNVAAWIAPVVKTLSRKWRQGVFDHGRAVDYVNRYCLVPAAKQYKLEHGSMATSWHQMFDKPTRDLAAESIVTHWVAEFKLGNFWD
jgi:hypothetical protein